MNVLFKVPGNKTGLSGELITSGDRIFIKSPYNEFLISEIKAMSNPKYHGYDKIPKKQWSVENTPRNRFALQYLQLDKPNPYLPYRVPIENYTSVRGRSLKAHQIQAIGHILKRKKCILAGEPGTGKTLTTMEVMEYLKQNNILKGDVWFVSVNSALVEVKTQFHYEWKSSVIPIFMNYDQMRIRIEGWRQGEKAPQVVVFDECSKLKTWKSKRSQAAFALGRGVDADWGDDGYLILCTGTPSPKSPADWWSQCEIACPGYLREGDVAKFTKRLALVSLEENAAGGIYPKIKTWFDNVKKCKKCGELENDFKHIFGECIFEASQNEVQKLHERLQGLVLVQLKKDCWDLPEKTQSIIRLKPDPSTVRLMNLILKTSERSVTALEKCRELSDGFQYIQAEVGQMICPTCYGKKLMTVQRHKVTKELLHIDGIQEVEYQNYEESTEQCIQCKGSGQVTDFARSTKYVKTGKEQLLRDLLEEYEDVGRFVVYAGFEASIDRVVSICIDEKWEVIRIDGRGWKYFGKNPNILSREDMLMLFKDKTTDTKLVIVGNPEAGGMGLNLTASPALFFWSNSFKADARQQAIERIHRPGMDENKGARIIDVIHIPTDEYVLQNLNLKKDLQDITMGSLKEGTLIIEKKSLEERLAIR